MTAAESIAALAGVVASVHVATAEGALIDLSGLEAEVGDALAAAAAAPHCEHGALRDALAHLITELDQLAAVLVRRRHAEAQQRAASAYGGADAAVTRRASDTRS
ncbi:MAG TPA: hypothetical protein VMU87_06370 [Stellaceae bacterium]|nr:hypothetical protein [Stellaceae bacterium]